jgi:hypothetical protein
MRISRVAEKGKISMKILNWLKYFWHYSCLSASEQQVRLKLYRHIPIINSTDDLKKIKQEALIHNCQHHAK